MPQGGAAMLLFLFHTSLAFALFFLVNWIGKHAVDFGYVSTTLFEEPNESAALNFFLRALSPAVFIIAVSAALVAVGHGDLRFNIFRVALYYYAFRAGVIFLLNRQRLISWPRYLGHALVGILAAMVAYKYLIVPNRSLLPDLNSAGNELWLAILAFLYAVANKVPLSGGPGARRRNAFVMIHYNKALAEFGDIIEKKIADDVLRLITYSILVYEDYCRPPLVRSLERGIWWKPQRTTGVMQVRSSTALSDAASIELGTDILMASWNQHPADMDMWQRTRSTIADYNRDEDYISRVFEVMEVLAKRASTRFKPAYDSIWE